MYSGTIKKKDFEFAKFKQELGIPNLQQHELKAGPEVVTSLPCLRPWMTAFGVGMINITGIRRHTEGYLEFQLADENNKPYLDGQAWATADKFFQYWPK